MDACGVAVCADYPLNYDSPGCPLADRAHCRVLAGIMLLGGIIVGTISVVKLGKALTPNPIPRIDGHLETKGLYALVRHPIYSAVLLAMLGVVVWGAGVWHLVFYGLLLALLGVKARAEERLLLERYPEYEEYGSRVGRFVPGLGKFR